MNEHYFSNSENEACKNSGLYGKFLASIGYPVFLPMVLPREGKKLKELTIGTTCYFVIGFFCHDTFKLRWGKNVSHQYSSRISERATLSR